MLQTQFTYYLLFFFRLKTDAALNIYFIFYYTVTSTETETMCFKWHFYGCKKELKCDCAKISSHAMRVHILEEIQSLSQCENAFIHQNNLMFSPKR